MIRRSSDPKLLREHDAKPQHEQGQTVYASQTTIQLPSIEDLLKGLPWPPAARHVSLPQTPYLPASTSGGSNLCRDPISQVQQPDSRNVDRDGIQQSKISVIERLHVPKMLLRESGGWVDTSHWLFIQVYAEFGACSIDELMCAGFRRKARPIYGENHFSTRGKTSDDFDDSDENSPFASGPRNNHRTKERDRRVRHQVLQRENDETTPTALFEMAERTLPIIKDTIKNMSRREKEKQNLMAQSSHESKAKTASGKNTGKDEQLLAAALFPHFCALLVIKLNQARSEAEDDALRLRQENAALRYAQLAGSHEVAVTPSSSPLECYPDDRRGSSASSILPPCQELLQPPVSIGKRARSDCDSLVLMTQPSSSPAKSSRCEGHKRRRFSFERMRRRLPPSPTPSVDDEPTSFSK